MAINRSISEYSALSVAVYIDNHVLLRAQKLMLLKDIIQHSDDELSVEF